MFASLELPLSCLLRPLLCENLSKSQKPVLSTLCERVLSVLGSGILIDSETQPRPFFMELQISDLANKGNTQILRIPIPISLTVYHGVGFVFISLSIIGSRFRVDVL